ncbi:hypothetical protein JRO89_XS11G0160700 [Xanthoceras sorbifolium]|uniref:Cytochrome P450 n=1 Tax=Xanthoceras sorbifolium TaxID=99658 RepID=A0ABQ8HFQ8_9ROSI|nr:hypothetical protein JRO89_XS11G0160700 [Xanthoceras sorbifolium]
MVKEVYAKVGSPINIGDEMFITILNVIMSMSWGGSLHGEDRSRVAIQFRQVVEESVIDSRTKENQAGGENKDQEKGRKDFLEMLTFFLSRKGDCQGNNFNFLPFSSGRRICPGIPLADRMLLYALATLLHSFEWKLAEGAELDFSEKFGVVLNKQEPRIAIPTAKLSSPQPQHYYH